MKLSWESRNMKMSRQIIFKKQMHSDITFICFSKIWFDYMQGFLRRFRDTIRVPGIENRVPRIRENYHRVPRIRENRVPRFREIGFLQVHTGHVTCSLKNPDYMLSVTDGHQNRRYRRGINCSRDLPSRWQIRSPQLPMVVKIIFTTHRLRRITKTVKGQL